MTLRNDHQPSEPIEFTAHAGECRYCKGVVKMTRHRFTHKLLPDQCNCLLCGQPYHVELTNLSIDEWDVQQWAQKKSS
jgi:hypothetical protein